MLAMIREIRDLLVAFHRWRIARFRRSLCEVRQSGAGMPDARGPG
jgi:hypothetical protein